MLPTRSKHTPRFSEHTVRSGDSLWDLAKRAYGDPTAWNHIAETNQIRDPNRIFVGQKLRLPVLNGPQRSRSRSFSRNHVQTPYPNSSHPHSWNPPLPVANPAYELNLEQLPETSAYAFPYRIRFKLKGKLTLQRRGVLTDFTISNLQKIEAEARHEVGGVLQDLASRVKVGFDVEKMSLDLSCALISTVKTRYGNLTHKLEFGFRSVKFVCETTSVAGEYSGILIQGTMGYEVEIEGEDLPPKRQPSFQPMYDRTATYPFFVNVNLWPMAGAVILVLLAVTLPASALAGTATVAFGAVYLNQRSDDAMFRSPQL